MRLEIPTFTRCCGCLPLRRGIIVLGYFSLVIAVFYIWVELQYDQSWTEDTMALYRGATFSVAKWLPVFLYCIEIVFIFILLVGAHTKRPLLLRIYYYYGITTTVAGLAIYLLSLLRDHPHHHFTESFYYYYYYVIDLCTIFIGIVTQAYLLLLVRSELQKHKPRSSHYVNHLEEACAPAQSNGTV